MRRSQKQKSWKRTAIKTATYFCLKISEHCAQNTSDRKSDFIFWWLFREV